MTPCQAKGRPWRCQTGRVNASIDDHQPQRHWERHADEWTDWARAPGHDAFWAYRDELRTFLPASGTATLDVGCGEGRLARELTSLGHTVTATDVAPSPLAAAEQAGSAHRYVLADATSLPFADASFDRVVAYNMLMELPEMPAAVAEAGRVLTFDGVLTVSIVHPFTDRGSFADAPTGEAGVPPFVVTDDYFNRSHFVGTEDRDGRQMHFNGWSYPLRDYVTALTDAGLAIIAMREPTPVADAAPELVARWSRLPLFLWLKARRIG